MKLPLSTATTSICCGAAALISSASAALRCAIASASNSTRIVVSPNPARRFLTVPAPTSRLLKKRTITSRPSGGGEASRARNGSPLPEPSVVFAGRAVQA